MAVARCFPVFAIPAATMALAFVAGCSGKEATNATSTGSEASSSASTPCDPLAPAATTLGNLLGVGLAEDETLYVADEVPDSGQDRVFVSSGHTLYAQDVTGSGMEGRGFDMFDYRSPSADASDEHTLLLQLSGGTATEIAVGSGYLLKGLTTIPDAGVETLAIADAGATKGFAVQGLPGIVQYVGDVSNGDAIVITAPMDAWGYSGFRLFYGSSHQMIERTITAYNAALSGSAQISFSVGASAFTLGLTIVYGGDAGPLGGPGPATLDTGSGGTLAVKLRLPTPTSLAGFSFDCF